MILTLKEEAYIDGHKSAFLGGVTDDGKQLQTGIWDNWFTAMAEDEDGKTYQVYWEIKSGFDPKTDDDANDACDWESPYMVIAEDGKNVLQECELQL